MPAEPAATDLPAVTIVFLVFNRRDELRESLGRMLSDLDYPRDRLDVVVVDNASTDGSAEMVRSEFSDVRLIIHERNVGVSGFNSGFAAAHGDWILALDDDCYLPPDGLRRALEAGRQHAADLVSFEVISTADPAYSFTDSYRTGLFTFWGCAVLMRRKVLEALGGYDPDIFVWANELEFMLRFFDHGFRHLHLPEVAAQHMKRPPPFGLPYSESNWQPHFYNCRHFAYIAAKLLQPRDAAEALVAIFVRATVLTLRVWRGAAPGIWLTFVGMAQGLRRRDPVDARVSRFYRRNFETFASPWWLWRSPLERFSKQRAPVSQREDQLLTADRRRGYFDRRAHLYPKSAATLDFTGLREPSGGSRTGRSL